ncbi:hypothetical protein HZS_5932, partial [Henneguya salminicola]
MYKEVKIIIIGAKSTGKTSIIEQFIDKTFFKNMESTLEISATVHKHPSVKKKAVFLIVDTSGDDRYSRLSFLAMSDYLKLAKELAPETSKYILVGNKVDLDYTREVTFLEAINYATRHNMFFYETSACTGYLTNELFYKCAEIINQKIDEGELECHSYKDKTRASCTGIFYSLLRCLCLGPFLLWMQGC